MPLATQVPKKVDEEAMRGRRAVAPSCRLTDEVESCFTPPRRRCRGYEDIEHALQSKSGGEPTGLFAHRSADSSDELACQASARIITQLVSVRRNVSVE